jgi:hypothetical protein
VAAPSTLRLAEVLAAISLASDVGHDRPLETSLRNAVIAARLGEEPGLARDEPAVAHGVSLLRSMGCTGNSHETALLFGGGDRAFVGLVQELAGGDSRALVRRMADHVSSSTPALEAARDERGSSSRPHRPALSADAACEQLHGQRRAVGADARAGARRRPRAPAPRYSRWSIGCCERSLAFRGFGLSSVGHRRYLVGDGAHDHPVARGPG